jgi:murein hydrolase activator
MLRAISAIAILAAIITGTASLPNSSRAETPGATKSFDEARGTLPWPVEGVQILGFGESNAGRGPSWGMAIKARPWAQVVSPCNGLIVFADEFRSYGNLVIISASDGYQFLLAGLSTIEAKVGQQVSAGELIGTLGAGAPVLTLELRKDQEPIDPAPWLRKS